MTPPSTDAGTADFDALRSKLKRVAYRMLGSVADADDILQEAFIRWRPTAALSVNPKPSCAAW
jgi:RNA polymerase sigma-70 factor (ECF subfamily)